MTDETAHDWAAYDDTITGGAGADNFVFDSNHGNDVITDFTDGEDLIDLGAFSTISGFSDLTLTSDENGVTIDLTAHDGGTVLLWGVDIDDLDAEDFVFHANQAEPVLDGGGTSGNDVLQADDDGDRVDGGDGDDDVWGGAGDDILLGRAGDDAINGWEGNDVLEGGAGDDRLHGGDGADDVWGAVQATTSSGAALATTSWKATGGDDDLYGGYGHDELYGGEGDDYLSGGVGNDLLYGGAGDDTLSSSTGDDTLYGDEGNDTLNGWKGNDSLDGGAGDDVLDGGEGGDTFVFSAGHGNDRIWDFADEEDLIDLTQLSGIAGFNDVTITADGNDAVIDLTAHGGGTIRLENFDVADLDAEDFVFAEPTVDPGAGVDGM